MKNKKKKTVTLKEYQMAEEKAVRAMALKMDKMNRTEKDEQTMMVMLELILKVTSAMQEILFGEETEEDDSCGEETCELFGEWVLKNKRRNKNKKSSAKNEKKDSIHVVDDDEL